jgi:hypothetical protein
VRADTARQQRTDVHPQQQEPSMQHRRGLVSAAAVLALAAALPAHAVLERIGPVNKAPAVGGYPAWFQDQGGIAVEFCDLKTRAEHEGGWCVLAPPDGSFPESFPNNFFDEHFYYAANNVLLDPGNGFRGRLVVALEAAFSNGPPVDGDQIVFGRLRVDLRSLPFDGDYRVITPFSDVTYYDQKAGDRIFETQDIGTGCAATFECALNASIGPFLLPSPVAGAGEVPPMPDLKAAPAGTDPFYDAMVAAGAGPTAEPGTNAKYLADPARVGPVTGSPLPNFTDSTGASRSHNNFRIEVRAPSPTHDGEVFYTVDGENNFTVTGRLMTGSLPGNLTSARATYKADGSGNVTALDVFAKASPTTQARIPAQPRVTPVMPVLNFYDQACGGALSVDPASGVISINPPPYAAPSSAAHAMAVTGSNYWGQSQPGGVPPSHACIEDTTARNAAGQVIPAYYLRPVTDDVVIGTAAFNGQANGTLTVNAASSDPTAVLTLAGYGPAMPTAPGTSTGVGAGTGLELAGSAATVSGLLAPPSQVQVVSSRGGAALRNAETAQGGAVIVGVPTAMADSGTIFEDCSATSAAACAPGQAVTIDLLANDTVLLNGSVTTLRNLVAQGLAAVTVTAQPARIGVAAVSPDGILRYTPNANANGADAVNYAVTVDGKASNQSVATINITPVNDAPVAGNTSVGAVVGKQNLMNLVGTSTDADGNADVKEAVIGAWPAALGAKPTPVNGVITYTPTTAGSYSFNYQVKDVAGALSANTASGAVSVAVNEVIIFDKHQYVQNKNRWTVDGTDNILQGQTITIAYEDGLLKGTTVPCNGTAANPGCIIGTSVVDGLGNWGIDKVGATGKLNPKDGTIWTTQPKLIRAFSTLPSLGGTAAIDIVFK